MKLSGLDTNKMSNKSIIYRMLEVREQFENKRISLSELASSLEAHGNALEGMGNEWQDLLISFGSECEYIEEMNDIFIETRDISSAVYR